VDPGLAIAALLYRHDPIGIAFAEYGNDDEYEPEARTIEPRLSSCKSVQDVVQVVHEEFVHGFGPETAGPQSDYAAIAKETWALRRAPERG
jgi:hypothetical protein